MLTSRIGPQASSVGMPPRWMTASAPAQAAVIAARSVTDAVTASSPGPAGSGSGTTSSSRSTRPGRASRVRSIEPMRPAAPVTRMVDGDIGVSLPGDEVYNGNHDHNTGAEDDAWPPRNLDAPAGQDRRRTRIVRPPDRGGRVHVAVDPGGELAGRPDRARADPGGDRAPGRGDRDRQRLDLVPGRAGGGGRPAWGP